MRPAIGGEKAVLSPQSSVLSPQSCASLACLDSPHVIKIFRLSEVYFLAGCGLLLFAHRALICPCIWLYLLDFEPEFGAAFVKIWGTVVPF